MRYESVGGKVLRCGYTTGACAAAASAAALTTLLSGERVEEIEITLPDGETVLFESVPGESSETFVTMGVVKDAGDDVDITDGMTVTARVAFADTPGIELHAGEGVGTVTKPGLSVEVGEPAINPVPRKMILSELTRLCQDYGYSLKTRGLSVTLSIPGGERAAEKTFNPRLGITGGLSILGTTGVVRPMSVEAIIATQKLELAQKKKESLVFVFGNIGESLAVEKGIDVERMVKVSNYIGEMLDEARRLGVKNILILGDLGKLVKLAGGIFRTHSSESDARMEILTAHLVETGAPPAVLRRVLHAPTTRAAAEILRENGYEGVFNSLAESVKAHVERRSRGEIKAEVLLYSGGKERAATSGAEKLLEETHV